MEDAHHALWGCEGVRVIWEGTALWQNLKRFGGGPLSELCLFVASNCTKDDLEVFCMVLWSIWLDRNSRVFEGMITKPEDVVTRAGRLLGDYCSKYSACEQKMAAT